jgi:hypothetical protein
MVSWVFLVFLAGSADRVDVLFGLDYVHQIWAYRFIVVIVPLIVAAIAYRVCIELQRGERVEHDRASAEAESGRLPGRDAERTMS